MRWRGQRRTPLPAGPPSWRRSRSLRGAAVGGVPLVSGEVDEDVETAALAARHGISHQIIRQQFSNFSTKI